MAKIIVTMKVLPDSPERDLNELKKKVENVIEENGGKLYKESIEPIAFGINAMVFIYIIDESKGTEEIENKVKEIEGTGDINISDMTRMME